MFDFLLDSISDSPGTYLALVGIIFVDDFVPFAPGDTAMITAGIVAANGGLMLVLVIAAGAAGGILGDNLFYFLGRRFGPGIAGRLLRSDRAKDGYRWTERHVMARGSTIVIVGRFIPGGRTVTTFACGTVGYPYRRFLPADTVAAVAWACYTALLGFIGGNSFRDALWQPLLIGLALAFLLGAGAEALRRHYGDSYEIEGRDIPQMVDAHNESRRRRGKKEVSEAEIRARAKENERASVERARSK